MRSFAVARLFRGEGFLPIEGKSPPLERGATIILCQIFDLEEICALPGISSGSAGTLRIPILRPAWIPPQRHSQSACQEFRGTQRCSTIGRAGPLAARDK